MNSAKRFLLVLGFCFVSVNLPAILMKRLAIHELTKDADLIVLGTVQAKSVHRDPESRIYTRIAVQVSEVWKGTISSNSLTIYQGGGTLGDEHQEVSGEAEYAVGEEVVAFLVLNQRGQPITLALAQGKFHVWLDKETGQKVAHNVFHGTPESARKATELAPGTAGQKKPARLKLNDFKLKVQEVKP